ncbi:MAG: hypothetical protein C3F15_06415 [Holophagae bacterium]|nr:MAG: hypothetical protein C3F15_06415 [Holophagae bacterium]
MKPLESGPTPALAWWALSPAPQSPLLGLPGDGLAPWQPTHDLGSSPSPPVDWARYTGSRELPMWQVSQSPLSIVDRCTSWRLPHGCPSDSDT